MKLRVQDYEVRFSVFNAVRHPAESDACFMIEAVEAIVPSQSGLIDLWRLAFLSVLRKT